MGYFKQAEKLSEPISDNYDFDYTLFGFMVLISPLAVPIYWLGRFTRWLLNTRK